MKVMPPRVPEVGRPFAMRSVRFRHGITPRLSTRGIPGLPPWMTAVKFSESAMPGMTYAFWNVTSRRPGSPQLLIRDVGSLCSLSSYPGIRRLIAMPARNWPREPWRSSRCGVTKYEGEAQ